MIKSMTAYASAEKTKENFTVLIEIRSYNSRYLDVTLRVPYGYTFLEDKIKGLVAESVSRGRIEMMIKIRDVSDAACAFEIDIPKAQAYHDALVQLKKMFDMRTELPLDLLVSEGGVIKTVEIVKDMDACWRIVKECLSDAMDDLDAMRKREGDFIAQDFSNRLDCLEKCVNQIENESGGLLSYYQERLSERISVLTKGIVEIDPARIVQEAAFLADRSDISEEIVRARSHIKQFRAIMDSAEPAGRKLNFLLQELNREFNTMGSKAGKANVSHMIVAVKSELEKIREQVQNVE